MAVFVFLEYNKNMKKIIIALIILVIVVSVWFLLPIKDSDNLGYFKDATYTIENQLVTLKNGYSEVEIVPGSASKQITRYFGNDAVGDLNGDDKDDIAFFLTQDNGGSGTFYYVAVALKKEKGYQGINAVFIGDRIAPQNLEIKDGELIVNYAEREKEEPISASPSNGVSKYFRVIDNILTEINK